MRRPLSVILFAAVVALSARSVGASPLTCPDLGTQFTLNPTAPDPLASPTCIAWGSGNINGNGDAINQLGFATLYSDTYNADFDVVDAGGHDDQGLFGTYTIGPNLWLPGTELVIAFKSGEGKNSPDWWAFELPFGNTAGMWQILGQNELSHANLYICRECGQTPPPAVPEPASLVLLGSGLVVTAKRFRARRP